MIEMAFAVLQLLFTAIACFALWRLWRAFASKSSGDRTFTWIVAAGFVLRAVAGQILFWISYLRLPLLRSLQLGDGFWFFAADGPGYLAWANAMVHNGIQRPWSLETIYPSRTYVEVLALFVAAFGSVASVAILLNCAAYLATCVLLLGIGTPARLPRLVALAAISFGPGTVLWSLQPLKDALFLLLVVALAVSFFVWQESQRRNPAAATSRAIAPAVAMLFVIYALAGLRWYFAAIIWAISSLFFFLAALPAPRRMRAMLHGIALFALMAASVRVGSGGDIAPFLRSFNRSGGGVTGSVSAIPRFLSHVRRGFERTGGATTIGGRPPAAHPPAVSAPTVSAPTVPAPTVPAPTVSAPTVPAPVVPAPVVPAPTVPAPTVAAPTVSAPPGPAPVVPAPVVPAPAVPAPTVPAPSVVPPPVVAPVVVARAAKPIDRPPATSTVAVVATPPSRVPVAVTPSQPALPQTTRGRLIAGAAATFLPRAVAQSAGLIDVRGGRGLWLFADLDTVVFELMLLFALIYIAVTLRKGRARVTPLFVLLLLVFVLTAIPLVYSVSNFGTLFRLRQMLYMLIVLMPLTLAPAD